MTDTVPVIDLFAGPGGLGEGFSSLVRHDGTRSFDIRLSIEKDPFAHQTLEIRSFFRQFRPDDVPAAYYEFLRATDRPLKSRRDELFDRHPQIAEAATAEAWHAELGKTEPAVVRERIAQALQDAGNWVLLGGPPCQAYSLIGRSRNRGNAEYVAENDHRQYLYVEYLQVLADHQPAMFVMENVKGLLSATLQNQRVFEQILDDLAAPSVAIRREKRNLNRPSGTRRDCRYRLFSIVSDELFGEFELRKFVVPMEQYGIPQARHRIIVIGVREDLGNIKPQPLAKQPLVTVRQVLSGLPRLRSGISREPDDSEKWFGCLHAAESKRWFRASANRAGKETYQELVTALESLTRPRCGRGGEFIEGDVSVAYRPDWYLDGRIGGVCHHNTRGHMVKDLWRYLYAACFAQARGQSPNLKHFPTDLLPAHRNVPDAMNGSQFSDRFRVQVFDRPATTVTSHISKDGHYYIHPDPTQCRSLTA